MGVTQVRGVESSEVELWQSEWEWERQMSEMLRNCAIGQLHRGDSGQRAILNMPLRHHN